MIEYSKTSTSRKTKICHFSDFQLFDVNAVRLTVNGQEIPYLVIDLTGGKRIYGYNTLFSGSGDITVFMILTLTEKVWEGGYGLFCLDTTPVGSGHLDHLIPHGSGNINLFLKF